MKVILSEDVSNLGKSGEVVEVKPGYGRNYLIPQKKAVLATEKNINRIGHEKRVILAAQAKPAQAKPLPGIGTLTGEVVAVLGTYKMIDITVSGRLLHITVNASTAFMKDGKPATFTMVERGQRITVSYKRDKNGRIIAVRVDLP